MPNTYTAPEGITTPERIKEMQQQLNGAGASLTVDGVWGEQTQAAYDTYGASLGSSSTNSTTGNSTPKFPNAEFEQIYTTLSGNYPTTEQLQADIEAALRPQYDKALADMEKQRIQNNAAIDVDAASRGMGNSTWVTDAKMQQLKNKNEYTVDLESDYAAQLYAALSKKQDENEDEAYQRALDMWQIEQSSKGNGGGGGTKPAGGGPDGLIGVDLNGDGNPDIWLTIEELIDFNRGTTTDPEGDNTPKQGGAQTPVGRGRTSQTLN